MPEKRVVEFVEEWQTGAFLLVSTAFVGLVVAGVGSVTGTAGRYVGLVGGASLTFLALSYLRYGR